MPKRRSMPTEYMFIVGKPVTYKLKRDCVAAADAVIKDLCSRNRNSGHDMASARVYRVVELEQLDPVWIDDETGDVQSHREVIEEDRMIEAEEPA